MPTSRPWPEWVPAAVLQEADELLQSIGADRTTPPDPLALRVKWEVQGLENLDHRIVETFELIERLICDDRMQRAVWGELRRPRRGGNGYLHPARRFIRGLRRDQLQDLALRRVFHSAVWLKQVTPAAVTTPEFERMCEPLATAEAQLKAAVEQAEKLQLVGPDERYTLARIAEKCSLRLSTFKRFHFVVQRQRGDPAKRAYIRALSLEIKKIFGIGLPNVVRTITDVAFDTGYFSKR